MSGKVDNENFSSYVEYNKILRTWLVAFGIGGPALLIVNEKLIVKLSAVNELGWIAGVFFLGVSLQVLGALINKYTNWIIYFGEVDESFQEKNRYTLALWLGRQLWIDIIFDLTSMAAFIYAVWIMVSVFA